MAAVSTRLAALILLMVLCQMCSAQSDFNFGSRYICPRDGTWSYLEELTDVGQNVYCFSVNTATGFPEAQAFCHSFQGEVLSLESRTALQLPNGIPLKEFLYSNGINTTWFGYHIQDDRLRRDSFPLPPMQDSILFREGINQIPWCVNEPAGTSQCFKADLRCLPFEGNQEFPDYGSGGGPNGPPPFEGTGGLAKRSVDDVMRKTHNLEIKATKTRVKRVVAEGEPLSFQCGVTQVDVVSHPCSDPLPFVCVKPALPVFSQALGQVEQICEPDELGSYKLSRCISYGKERVNYTTAQSRCHDKGADAGRSRTLYRSSNTQSQRFLNRLVFMAIMRAESRKEEIGLPPDTMAWVEGSDRGECPALFMGGQGDVDSVSWDCSAQLPLYICQHKANRKEPSSLELTYRASSGDIPVDLKAEAIPSTTDTQLSIPYEMAVFASNDMFYLTCSYRGGLVPEIQNMTVVKRGFTLKSFPSPDQLPVLAKRQAEFPANATEKVDTLEVTARDWKNFFWGDDSLGNLADYYWCEVNDLKTGKVHRSNRLFLRVQGMQIYTATMVLNTTEFERQELILYSLTGYDSARQVSSLQQRMVNATLYAYRWLRFRPDLSEPNSTSTVADFYVFKREVTTQDAFKPTNWTIANTASILSNDFRRNLDTRFFSVMSLTVRSLDICPYRTVYDPISNRSYEIPDTPLGTSYTSRLICLSNGLSYVTLKCVGDKLYGARWARFEPNSGCDFANASSSPVSDTLKGISLSDISNETVVEKVNETIVTIAGLKVLEPVDVVYIADILQKATDEEISPETGRQILGIINTVNQLDDITLGESQDLGNATNRLIKAVDKLGDSISLGDKPNLRLVTDSTALEVWNISHFQNGEGDIIIGLELRLDGGEPVKALESDDLVSLFESGNLTYKATDAAIFLPKQFVRNVTQGKDAKLAMSVYTSTALFRKGRLYNGSEESSRNLTLNSKVISAKISVNGVPISDLYPYLVTTVYLPFIETPEQSRPQNTTCVFWDLEGAGGTGAWSGDGCRYQQTFQGRDVCVCDHLTNFAVLVDLYGQAELPQEHQFALTIITIIGLCLSIAGLSITIISFLLIKKLRQGRPQQTLFNLALAMLASWIVFLAGFTRVENHVGCVAVAALLHYFILASFMWMLMEGILQYLLFVKVFGTEFDNYMLKTGIPAWGIPLIPVIVVLGIDTDMYRGGDQYCWMSLTPFYYAFLLPVCAVMLANIVIYIMVVVAICRRRDMTSHANRSGASQRVIGIRASIACFVVLGLSWVFAFFAVEDARVVFQYLFTITSTIQGFLIFLIFTARDPQVRAFWKAKCCGKTKGGEKSGDRAHVQGQRSHTGSDEYPLNRSNQSSSTDDPRYYHSRRTSPTTLPSPSGSAYSRGTYGNGHGDGYETGYRDGYGNGSGYGNPAYQVYTGE